MDKFNFYGYACVVMTQDESEKMLLDAYSKGYMAGIAQDIFERYELGKRV